VVIELGALRPALLRAARMFAETAAIPTLLLFILLHTVGLMAGLVAVLGWCALTVTVRWILGRRLPGTLVLCAGMLCARACVALILSSALVYLLQPVAGSIIMATLFLGSAALGRPITIRLARDFVALPAHLFHHPGVRRMFTQVALLWGAGRLIDAGMSIGFPALEPGRRSAVPGGVQRAADRHHDRGLRGLGLALPAPASGNHAAPPGPARHRLTARETTPCGQTIDDHGVSLTHDEHRSKPNKPCVT
jgi:hypothetical protein